MTITFRRLLVAMVVWSTQTAYGLGLPVIAQTFPYRQCHMESSAARPMFGLLKFRYFAPNCTAQNWIVYAPVPPELPEQSKPRASLTVNGTAAVSKVVQELSNEHRIVIYSLIPVTTNQLQHELSVQVNYWTSLIPRHLVAGAGSSRLVPLSSLESSMYLAPSETCDFASPAFQTWLAVHNLRRRSGEGDLDFAWRTFLTIRDLYSYMYNSAQDRHVSKLCKTDATDCGGLSFLFVSTLRANGIPARSLIGRWADPKSTADQNHVKSEFYTREQGWIPIEMSGAVSNKAGDPLLFFGQFNGDFMTFHFDTDLLLDTIWFGRKSMRNMQQPAFWVTGPGALSGAQEETTWRVQPIAAYQ